MSEPLFETMLSIQADRIAPRDLTNQPSDSAGTAGD